MLLEKRPNLISCISGELTDGEINMAKEFDFIWYINYFSIYNIHNTSLILKFPDKMKALSLISTLLQVYAMKWLIIIHLCSLDSIIIFGIMGEAIEKNQ